MAKRSLEDLQKRYNSMSKAGGPGGSGRGPGGPGRGPGGPGGPHGPRGGGLRGIKKPKNTGAIVKRLMGYVMAYRVRLI